MGTCPAADGSHWPAIAATTLATSSGAAARSRSPHVAQNPAGLGGSALDASTVRHRGYAISQWVRKRVEETFGWMKTVGGLRRTRYHGRERVQMHAYLVAAAYNLVRIAKLSQAPA
jgi:hypothetical protein